MKSTEQIQKCDTSFKKEESNSDGGKQEREQCRIVKIDRKDDNYYVFSIKNYF